MARTNARVSQAPVSTSEALAAALAAMKAATEALAAVAAAHAPEPAPEPKGAAPAQSLDWAAYRPDTTGMTRDQAKAARSAAYARMQAGMAKGAPKAPKAKPAAPKAPKAEPAKAPRPMHEPDGPATASQLWFLHLLLNTDTRTPEYARMTKAEASELIAALRAEKAAK